MAACVSSLRLTFCTTMSISSADGVREERLDAPGSDRSGRSWRRPVTAPGTTTSRGTRAARSPGSGRSASRRTASGSSAAPAAGAGSGSRRSATASARPTSSIRMTSGFTWAVLGDRVEVQRRAGPTRHQATPGPARSSDTCSAPARSRTAPRTGASRSPASWD